MPCNYIFPTIRSQHSNAPPPHIKRPPHSRPTSIGAADQTAFKTRTRAVVSLAASLLAACAPHAPPEAKLPVVDVTPPLKRSIIERDTYPGRFDAVDSVDIRPRVGGFIDAVLFKDGELVHKGDVLFRIDPRPYAAAVEQAVAQVAAAKSQLLLANQELDRAKTLIATSTIAPELFERRHQSAQAAAAAIQVSQAALFRARLDLSFCQVIAPMTGRISRHLVSVGNLVEAGGGNGTLLTTIVSIDPIDFYFDIDEKSYLRYAALVQQGQRRTVGGEGTEVRIRLPGEKTATHKGTLDFVDNRLDRSTGTLRVRARIGNQDSTLSPGQFGRAELISTSAHPALLVPNIALVTQPTGKVLDVVGSDNKVAEREVILGGLFGAWREIRAGLKPDDRILVAGFQEAQVGSVVTPHLVDADSSSFSEQGELE